MTRSATLYSFPATAWHGPASRAEIDAAVLRGRRLHGEAMRGLIREAAGYLIGTVLIGGCLRSLRLQGGRKDRRQLCC